VALGAEISGVQANYPAANAGLGAGEIVTAVDGQTVKNAAQMSKAMSVLKPGQSVTLKLSSGRSLTIPTVKDPQDKSRAIIGVFIGDGVHIGKIPVHVHFSTAGIGGPSAGLAFALDIYDSLTGRKLLHGNKVAVTGELALNGSVIPIGGVKQKTIGAIEAGAQTFIVPEGGGNYRDAKAAADGKIKIVGVTSFDQALAAIHHLRPR
jgi:PDZ domain-containing protein